MYRRHGDKLGLVFLACDLAVTAGAWTSAYWLRFACWPAPDGVPQAGSMLSGLPLILLLSGLTYRLCGLYEIHRLRQLPREVGVVCRATGLLFVLVITLTFYRRDAYESRLALALFLLLNSGGLLLGRRVLWHTLRQLRQRGMNYGRAIIVGTGRTGRLVAETLRNNRWTGLEAVGVVDDPPPTEPTWLPRLGSLEQLPSIVRQQDVDHVFLALPLSRYDELPRLNCLLSDMLIDVQFVPDLPDLTGIKLRMREIDDVAFLSLRANPHQGWHQTAKRAMDLAVASLALVVLSPLMLMLAGLVKLTSRGPVFYRQWRDGENGRPFAMLKFRSMRVDAEQTTGPVWAAAGDARCTTVGRFMRRYNLDELPQLFNVLAGSMSLVGPRPERGVFVERFRHQIPNYAQRLRVKAGMTGWAQIHGWRGNSSLRRRVEFDLYYISNWTLWLDVVILWLTIWRGFRQRHAY